MKQSNIASPRPARSRRIAGRAQEDHILDPYQRQRKLPEGTLCPQCGAVFHRGRWQWSAPTEAADRETCPACRRIADRLPAGVVIVKGLLSVERADELVHLARHEEEAEKREHPLNRIISVEHEADSLIINTTDIHLPRRIGEAIEHIFHVTCEMHFDRDNFLARVTCALGE